MDDMEHHQLLVAYLVCRPVYYQFLKAVLQYIIVRKIEYGISYTDHIYMEIITMLFDEERATGIYQQVVTSLDFDFPESYVECSTASHTYNRQQRITHLIFAVYLEKVEVSFRAAVIVIDRDVHILNFRVV